MRKKAAMSEQLKAEYEKQLRRIKRMVRSAIKRGYDFPEHAIPKRPKTITEASVRRVASITPDVLYKKSTYTKNTGEKISGIEGRKHERQQAAIKAAETRALKAGKKYSPKNRILRNPQQHTTVNKKRATNKTRSPHQHTPTNKKRTNETPSDRYYKGNKAKQRGKRQQAPERTNVVLANVLATLEHMLEVWAPLPHWTPSFGEIKRRDRDISANILNNAIDQLGREQVAMNCEKWAEEIIPLLEEILYGSGSLEGNFKDGRTQVNFDIIRFQNMLLARPTTPEENIELVDWMERAVYEEADDDNSQYRESSFNTSVTTSGEPYTLKSGDDYKLNK